MTPNFFLKFSVSNVIYFLWSVGQSVGRSLVRNIEWPQTILFNVMCQHRFYRNRNPHQTVDRLLRITWNHVCCEAFAFDCCSTAASYMVSYQIQLKWTLAHIDCDPQIKGSPLMLAASRTVDHFVQVVCWSLSDGRDRFAFHRMQCWRMPTTNICMLSIWWGEIEMKCSLRFVLHQCQWQCVCYWFN